MKKFLPLLLFYLLLIIMFSSNTLKGDEDNYAELAIRLSQGYYSPPNGVNLWLGPGYPTILLPFAILKLPWFIAKLLNALLLFGAILYFNRILRLYIPEKYALIFTYLLGLYPPFIRQIPKLMTESLVFLLICGFMFHLCKLYKSPKHSKLHLFTASIYLAYIAITKIFFGYVILTCLLSFLFLYLWRRRNALKKTTLIFLFALVWCLPYLLYSYLLTGKIFYWGTSGGMSLYWMSTPYENEWGDWFSFKEVQERPDLANHKKFFNEISSLSEVEKDNAFKKKAIYNIIHYPKKYLTNWLANIGRLLFSYPFSYEQQKLSTYFYILPNIFIIILLTLSIYPCILSFKSIPYEIYCLLFFSFISLGGTSLLSAYERQFRPFVPILLLWLSYLYTNVIEIKVRRKI